MIYGFLWRCVYRGSYGVRMPVVTVDKQEKGEEKHMNQKEGLDYFPMECVTDENIKLITAEFGLQAFAIIANGTKRLSCCSPKKTGWVARRFLR